MRTWRVEDFRPASTGLDVVIVAESGIQRFPGIGWLLQRDQSGSVRFILAVLAGDEAIPAERALSNPYELTTDPAVGVGIYVAGQPVPPDDLIGPAQRLLAETQRMEQLCA